VQRLLMRIEAYRVLRREQVHHAARAPLGACGDPQTAARSESPTIHSAEGFPDKIAIHAVCRENVFWRRWRP